MPNGPRGIPIDFRRLDTSKDLLAIEWTFPVYAPDLEQKQEEGKTYAGRAKVALERAKAFEIIRADDRRPLLVVRECGHCKGTEDALLSRRLNNEKTLLLTRWFRCVKLPNHVLGADHPFRNLFDQEKPPHLFLAKFDGSDVVAMDGQQTQSQLWKAMEDLIASEYEGRASTAVKGLLRCLNDYDTVDSRATELSRQMEETLDKKGPRSPKVRSLALKLKQIEKHRERIDAKWEKLIDLGLKAPTKQPGTKKAD